MWVQSLGWEDSPGGGYGHLLQYSCLENPMDSQELVGYIAHRAVESGMVEET